MSKNDLSFEEIFNKYSEIFNSLFDQKEEALSYCKKLNEIDEFFTFFQVLQFFYLFNEINKIDSKGNAYLKIMIDTNRLLMMASIVELLNSDKKFVPFNKWIKIEEKENELKEKGIKVWHDYNKIHGSAKKFRDFFKNLLNIDEQIALMKKVQFNKNGRMNFLPLFCYKNGQCNYHFGTCEYDTNKELCPAYKSEQHLNKGIKECANFLYSIRSKFVHEANLFIFPSPLPKGVGGTSTSFDYFEYKFITKNYSHQGLVSMELFTGEFVYLVQKYLRQLLDKYIESVKKNQE